MIHFDNLSKRYPGGDEALKSISLHMDGRPFLYSGMLMGLIGAMSAAFILVVGFWWLGASVAQLSELYNSQYRLLGPGLKGCILLIVTGVGLGLCGSWLAVGRHLKEIKPR